MTEVHYILPNKVTEEYNCSSSTTVVVGSSTSTSSSNSTVVVMVVVVVAVVVLQYQPLTSMRSSVQKNGPSPSNIDPTQILRPLCCYKLKKLLT